MECQPLCARLRPQFHFHRLSQCTRRFACILKTRRIRKALRMPDRDCKNHHPHFTASIEAGFLIHRMLCHASITFSSTKSIFRVILHTLYGSSNAATAHSGKSLAVEWAESVRINCVSLEIRGHKYQIPPALKSRTEILTGRTVTLSWPEETRARWTSMDLAKRMAFPPQSKGVRLRQPS